MAGRVSRRAVLRAAVGLGGAAAAGSACTAARDVLPGPTPAPSADPDAPVRHRAAAGSQALLDRYAATVARHPVLAARLAPLAAEHRAHLAAVGGGSDGTPSSGPPTATPAPTAVAVPATPAAALAALAAAESAAARARLVDTAAASPGLARLLASVGACQAAHAALLRTPG